MSDYECKLDASGWELYSYEGEEGESVNRAKVKRRGVSLSKRLTKLVRKAKERLQANPMLSEAKVAASVRDEMYKLMSKYSDSGACDSEPEGVLVSELETAFDLEQYSLER
jgi:hypothetical protein